MFVGNATSLMRTEANLTCDRLISDISASGGQMTLYNSNDVKRSYVREDIVCDKELKDFKVFMSIFYGLFTEKLKHRIVGCGEVRDWGILISINLLLIEPTGLVGGAYFFGGGVR